MNELVTRRTARTALLGTSRTAEADRRGIRSDNMTEHRISEGFR